MYPAWEMHKLGDPKAPACYLIRMAPPREVGPADVSMSDTTVEHRFFVDPRKETPEDTRDMAYFALKSLIAEQIVDALAHHEAGK